MERIKTIAARVLLVLTALFWALNSVGEAETIKLSCSAKETIGNGLKKLKPGDTLLASGRCNENDEIPPEASKITLDGQGKATIKGPDSNTPTIRVTGRRIIIEEAAKVDLVNLEMERARLQAAEERIAKEKARTEEARLEAERKEKGGEASKASQAQVIAQLQPPASISRPPVVLPTVAEMPKYKVGDSWTVRFADGRTSRRIVRAIEKDQYVFEWGSDLWRYYDQNLVLIKQVTPEDGKEVRTSLLTRRTMEFPLAANKTWGFRYRLVVTQAGGVPAGTGVWREFSFKVLGTETINTPAGPFGTLKVEETSYESQCLGGVCQTLDDTVTVRHLWYAPEAKFIVKVAEVRGRYISEQEPDYELITFDLKD